MAARKPIICLDVGGPGVQVTKEAGIKIAASNPEQTIMQLAEAMIRLASDNELRRQMGEAGRAHVISQYTCGHKIDQQLVYYAEAVERAETGTKEPVGRHGPHPGCLQGSQLTEER
jgi:glycosyltransferase involved in cell wall biosynthesis